MVKDTQYFPKDYQDARAYFQDAIRQLAAPKEIGSWMVPSRRDQDLTVDYVWLPPTESSETLMVITSGIHGSESYAGSAIQRMFIEELLPRVDRRHLGIWLVHCMNPYGFKYHQRGTENFVNLNRNFSVDGRMFGEANAASKALCERFLSRERVASMQCRMFEAMRREGTAIFFEDVSLDEFTKGFAKGQFETPQHLEFGGKKLEPQSQSFIDKLKQIIPPFQEILGLDLHTGLGHRGRLHLLVGGPGERLDNVMFKKYFDPQEDKEFYEFTPPTEEGFYEVQGAINSVFGQLSNSRQKVCGITMEFGTLGHSLEKQLEGLNLFILEHQGTFFGYADQKIEDQIRQANFSRSYVNDDLWKTSIIHSARGLFERVLGRKSLSAALRPH